MAGYLFGVFVGESTEREIAERKLHDLRITHVKDEWRSVADSVLREANKRGFGGYEMDSMTGKPVWKWKEAEC